MAEPSDVADVCLFLASPLARYVSGESIVVHGGGERPAYLDAAKNTLYRFWLETRPHDPLPKEALDVRAVEAAGA